MGVVLTRQITESIGLKRGLTDDEIREIEEGDTSIYDLPDGVVDWEDVEEMDSGIVSIEFDTGGD